MKFILINTAFIIIFKVYIHFWDNLYLPLQKDGCHARLYSVSKCQSMTKFVSLCQKIEKKNDHVGGFPHLPYIKCHLLF